MQAGSQEPPAGPEVVVRVDLDEAWFDGQEAEPWLPGSMDTLAKALLIDS